MDWIMRFSVVSESLRRSSFWRSHHSVHQRLARPAGTACTLEIKRFKIISYSRTTISDNKCQCV